MRGDLERRENRDPGDAGGEHGHGQQTDILHVRERKGRKRVERARACNQRIARNLRPQPGQQHGAGDGSETDAGEQQPVDLRTPPQLLPHDQGKQRPGRTREHEERAATDEYHLQRLGVHDEAHADANRAHKALGGQRALVVLAPPPQQHRENADVGDRIEQENKPRTDRRNQNARDGRSNRARCVNGNAVERDGRRHLVGRDELGYDRRPRRHHQCGTDPEREREPEQHPRGHDVEQRQDPKRTGDDQQIDLDDDQQPSAVDDVGKGSGRERKQHQWKTVRGLDQRHHRRRG